MTEDLEAMSSESAVTQDNKEADEQKLLDIFDSTPDQFIDEEVSKWFDEIWPGQDVPVEGKKPEIGMIEMYLQQSVMNGINDVYRDMQLEKHINDDVWYKLVIDCLNEELENYKVIQSHWVEEPRKSCMLYWPAPINELYREMSLEQAVSDAILTFFAMCGETQLSNRLWREYILRPMMDAVFVDNRKQAKTYAGYTLNQLKVLDLFTLKAIAGEMGIDLRHTLTREAMIEAITV